MTPAWTAPLAATLSASVALRVNLAMGFTPGLVAGLAAAPMWVGSLKRYRDAPTTLVLVVTSMCSGVLLTWHNQATNHTSVTVLVANSILVATIGVIAGTLLWAREHAGVRTVALCFGLGMLAASVYREGLLPGDNPWKSHLAVPVTVIALALAHRDGRRSPAVIVLLVFAGLNAMFDSRSAFAVCVLAAFLVAAQSIWEKGHGSARARAAAIALVCVALAAGIYVVGTELTTAGYLGEEAQQRSLAQAEIGGSVIVGGRPEMAATVALMGARPLGFGSGTSVNLHDLLVAKAGMWSINYNPDNGYVERYMFGGGIKLHSVVGDMWAYFGIPGLVLAIWIAFALGRALVLRLASGQTPGVTAYIVCTALWNILFGPLQSTAPIIGLALGLALLPRVEHDSSRQ